MNSKALERLIDQPQLGWHDRLSHAPESPAESGVGR
jgi:hypothetical protein